MKLQREFYERDTLIVARELLGKYLVHESHNGKTVGKIVETEAYIGPDDAAAHTYKGRRTDKTEVAFGRGGHAYVYMIYGMYHCFNIVTNTAGKPEMVLVRALEPVDGLELMKKRRGTNDIGNLCSGPGKLCIAMNISRLDHATDLCANKLYLCANVDVPEEDIVSTPRINVDYAGEAASYPWRFLIRGNRFVSRK